MIAFTTPYDDKLQEIQNMGLLRKAMIVPHNTHIMEINLDTRIIEKVPQFLSVSKDHQSETVYFKFDRFFDNIDLTQMVCVIQYKNALNEEYLYPVPFYDMDRYANEGKILIPWCIQGGATKAAGLVWFSIRFFRLDPASKTLVYDLNTIPAKSKILQGQDWNLENIKDTQIHIDNAFLQAIQDIMKITNELNLYWVDA